MARIPAGSRNAARAGPGGVLRRGLRRSAPKLLDRDGGAGALEGSLGLLRRVLVDLLEDGLGGAVDQVLGLLETEAGERAHLLDDLDLLVAGGLEDDVELVLLLGLFHRRRAAAAGRSRDRDRGGRLDV